VVAWFPPPNQEEPPKGWVRCDGKVINEGKSPFDGENSPNLNGEKLFLRGSKDIERVQKKKPQETKLENIEA